MKLRSYQDSFVIDSISALDSWDGVIGIAATGAGKTVMLSAIASEYQRVLILQHRTELLDQNSETFSWVNPLLKFGFVCSGSNDWDKPYTFGMMQTVERRLDHIQSFDLIIIDECHHAVCSSYLKIIDKARLINPELKLLGVTATPERADKIGLSSLFSKVAARVPMDYLIRRGYLVQPKAYTIKVATEAQLKAAANDDEQIEAILNVKATNERVIEEWRAKAGNRQTIIFCQTRNHAIDVSEAFREAGLTVDYVDGLMNDKERKKRLKKFDKGKTQIMVNVNVLTEGFDSQPVSCVILLRASSSKSALIQMVGRGLRKLDPTRYPKVKKSDCIVLDFGVSLIRHGNLDAGERLSFGEEYEDQEDDVIQCERCGWGCEPSDITCQSCGYVLRVEDEKSVGSAPDTAEKITDFTMTEHEIMKESVFHYEKFKNDGRIASAWSAWAMVYQSGDYWYSIAAKAKCRAKIIGYSQNKIECLATCDDFISQHGDPRISNKINPWLSEQATPAQMALLPEKYHHLVITKHQASCLLILTAKGRWDRIQSLVNQHYLGVINEQ